MCTKKRMIVLLFNETFDNQAHIFSTEFFRSNFSEILLKSHFIISRYLPTHPDYFTTIQTEVKPHMRYT